MRGTAIALRQKAAVRQNGGILQDPGGVKGKHMVNVDDLPTWLALDVAADLEDVCGARLQHLGQSAAGELDVV